MIKELRRYLKILDTKIPEEKLVYQVMDLELIKYKGKEKECLPKDMENIIDSLIKDWIWLYDRGLSMALNPIKVMNENEIARFNDMIARFGLLSDFMNSNMNLIEE